MHIAEAGRSCSRLNVKAALENLPPRNKLATPMAFRLPLQILFIAVTPWATGPRCYCRGDHATITPGSGAQPPYPHSANIRDRSATSLRQQVDRRARQWRV
jgi:hypothetical protein